MDTTTSPLTATTAQVAEMLLDWHIAAPSVNISWDRKEQKLGI